MYVLGERKKERVQRGEEGADRGRGGGEGEGEGRLENRETGTITRRPKGAKRLGNQNGWVI